MLRGLHYNSRADKQKYCALCEERIESVVVLVHTVGINFRYGGKLDFQCLNLYFQGQRIQWDQIQEPIAHMQAVFFAFKSVLGWKKLYGNKF